jgi:membrane protein implicated in regulation of membrane protease activity
MLAKHQNDMQNLPLPEGASTTVTDIFKVVGVTFAANAVSLADIEKIVSIASLVVATAYVLWKWYRDIQKNKKHEKLHKAYRDLDGNTTA